MPRLIIPLFGLLLLFPVAATGGPEPGSITLDLTRPGARIPSSLYGVFFEEISHAGDGGLYAEMVQNRGFEESRVPPVCRVVNGELVPPRTEHYATGRVSNWTMPFPDKGPWPSWSIETTGGSVAKASLVTESPLSEAQPHSLKLEITKAGAAGRAAAINEGYWGIAVRKGERYRLRFFTRTQGLAGPITATIEGSDGAVLARSTFKAKAGSGWREYRSTLTASSTEPKGRLALSFGGTGTVWLDFVSLFPERTFKRRENGLREDLARMVADLKPAFIRWPGGCFTEGVCVGTEPDWKTSLGPVEQRPGTYSVWGYWSTDGFGYHEFLQYCEDIGAAAMYVASTGLSCEFRSGTYRPDSDLPAIIQNNLDAIEYAIGPTSSRWGALRAKYGHPTPFPLKYLEIGNEQHGPLYLSRYRAIAAAVKAKYPQIQVILNMGIIGLDRRAIREAASVDLADEHSYRGAGWALRNWDYFDRYPREPGYKLYVGEWATNGGVGRGNFNATLSDAVYMLGMERNADLVSLSSYAPLLENVNRADWNVNLIHYDAARSYGRASYHLLKLFADNRPDVNLPTHVSAPTSQSGERLAGSIGLGTWNTAAEYRDLRVESGGKTVYAPDFSHGAEGWTPRESEWEAKAGVYRQKEERVGWTYFRPETWSDVTISLKARKLSGREGFMVVFHHQGEPPDPETTATWNIGGWNNTQHAIQLNGDMIGAPVPGRIDTGRWYDIRIEARGQRVRCFLDGKQIHDVDLGPSQTVFALGGRDEKSGETVLKVVNARAQAAPLALRITGGAAPSRAETLTLSSPDLNAENSFAEPERIVPVRGSADLTRSYSFPANSITVLRWR